MDQEIKPQLTTGAIERIMQNEEVLDKPIFEVLLIKSNKAENVGTTRLILTDGDECIPGLLQSDTTIFSPSKGLRVHSVVRLIDYNIVKTRNKSEIVISSLEIISESLDDQGHSSAAAQENENHPLKRLRTSEVEEDPTFIDEAMLAQITKAETCLTDVNSSATNLSNAIESNLQQLNLLEKQWQKIGAKAKEISDEAPNIIKLDMRGKICKVKKDTLLDAKYSLFHAMISTDIFKPNENGAYFLDIAPDGYERMLLSLENEDTCMHGANAYEEHLLKVLNTTVFYSDSGLLHRDLQEEEEVEMEDEGSEYDEEDYWGTLGIDALSELRSLFKDIRSAGKTACRYVSVLKRKIVLLQRKISHWNLLLERLKAFNIAAECDIISLDLKGRLFKAYRETFMRNDGSYFHAMLSSGSWVPDEDGVYFIDRWHYGFERILEYMSSGRLHLDGLAARDIECVMGNMEYFQLKPPSIYSGHSDKVCSIIQLKDGRFCIGSIDGEIKIWDKLSSDCELTLSGHKPGYLSVIQLSDGSLCSCSHDGTVRLWTLTQTTCTKCEDFSRRVSMIQELSNGNLCVLVTSTSYASHGAVLVFNKNLARLSQLRYSSSITCFTSLTNEIIIVGTDQNEVIPFCVHYSYKYEPSAIVCRGHTGQIEFLAGIDNVTFCSAAINDSILRIWNAKSSEPLKSIQCDAMSPFIGGQFVRDSVFNFYCKSEGVIKFVNLRAHGEEPKVRTLPIDFGGCDINVITQTRSTRIITIIQCECGAFTIS